MCERVIFLHFNVELAADILVDSVIELIFTMQVRSIVGRLT